MYISWGFDKRFSGKSVKAVSSFVYFVVLHAARHICCLILCHMDQSVLVFDIAGLQFYPLQVQVGNLGHGSARVRGFVRIFGHITV